MAANLKYVTAAAFGVSPFIVKNGQPAARDPETGALVSMNMMADAREPTLRTGRVGSGDASRYRGAPSRRSSIGSSSSRVRCMPRNAAPRRGQPGRARRSAGTPAAMASGSTGTLGNNTTRFVFPMGESWKSLPRTGEAATDARNAFRESVARGHDVFFFRTFWIRDAMHINTSGLVIPPSARARRATACT